MKDVIIWHVDANMSIVGFVYRNIIMIITNFGLPEDVQVNILRNILSMVKWKIQNT